MVIQLPFKKGKEVREEALRQLQEQFYGVDETHSLIKLILWAFHATPKQLRENYIHSKTIREFKEFTRTIQSDFDLPEGLHAELYTNIIAPFLIKSFKERIREETTIFGTNLYYEEFDFKMKTDRLCTSLPANKIVVLSSFNHDISLWVNIRD
jgi:hypothetical protein